MPRPKINLVIEDPASGRARPGAWTTFYLANTVTLATLYADDDVSTLMNPVQANALGQVAVRVDPGLYDVLASWDGTQPTMVEDILAWVPEGAVLSAPGDLIVGGSGGAPTRLPVGTQGQVLLVDGGVPVWRMLGSGYGMPTGATGALVRYAAGNLLAVIP